MLLKNKIAVIHGGGGAIGGATARVFAREGAHVFLAGRTRAKLDAVTNDIRKAGGIAEVAIVDALDEAAVNAHADAVVEKAGCIDITLNAVGIMHVQGLGLAELSTAQFMTPVEGCTRTNFITAKAAARHMAKQGAGVILTLSTPGARISGKGFLGYGVACGAIETLTRILAGELGEQGVRVVCLRPDAIPDALPLSYAREVFGEVAERFGTTPEAMLEAHAQSATLLKRLPKLRDVAEYASFIASDRASATTGAIVNLTCGSVLD
jgi:NAD(P)-dependent dehydrogenase (short-subunit alcohol dehydrogenase family)